MFNQQIPFEFALLSCGDTVQVVKTGQIISTINKCGFFLCRQGEIEIFLQEKSYIIKRRDLYIYIPSTLVRLLHKSADAEGIMVGVDLDYVIPIVNKVTNVENLLFIREYPCVSLSDEQYKVSSYLFSTVPRVPLPQIRSPHLSYRILRFLKFRTIHFYR